MSKLTPVQVESLLNEAAESFPHESCLACECFLGLVAQFRIDGEHECKDLLNVYKIERNNIHSCLGCEPCPPGNLFAAYMRKKQGTTLITL
jgi:hypothetical protein